MYILCLSITVFHTRKPKQIKPEQCLKEKLEDTEEVTTIDPTQQKPNTPVNNSMIALDVALSSESETTVLTPNLMS